MANTVKFEGKYSGIQGKYVDIFGKYIGIWATTVLFGGKYSDI